MKSIGKNYLNKQNRFHLFTFHLYLDLDVLLL